MVLIHTVRTCIGADRFTPELRSDWIAVYSKMMNVMIPIVISGRLPDENDQDVNNFIQIYINIFKIFFY
jgi:hypothetical protein